MKITAAAPIVQQTAILSLSRPFLFCFSSLFFFFPSSSPSPPFVAGPHLAGRLLPLVSRSPALSRCLCHRPLSFSLSLSLSLFLFLSLSFSSFIILISSFDGVAMYSAAVCAATTPTTLHIPLPLFVFFFSFFFLLVVFSFSFLFLPPLFLVPTRWFASSFSFPSPRAPFCSAPSAPLRSLHPASSFPSRSPYN